MVSAALLSAAFAVIAASYSSLPADLPVTRSWSGQWTRVAPTSALVAFRLPMMGLLAALVAGLMRSAPVSVALPERRTAYTAVFGTLMLTAASKALCESLEIASLAAPAISDSYRSWLWFATLVVTLSGLTSAAVCGWALRAGWRLDEWRLDRRTQVLIVALALGYAAAAALPLVGARSPFGS